MFPTRTYCLLLPSESKHHRGTNTGLNPHFESGEAGESSPDHFMQFDRLKEVQVERTPEDGVGTSTATMVQEGQQRNGSRRR